MTAVSPEQFPDPPPAPATSGTEVAVLAGGCFWCTEAVFQELQGVRSVTSGYCGGDARSANYQAVCSGNTGHAEAIRIEYAAERLSFGQILKVFFSVAHDPTQRNRQGADRGPQYRSAIFYTNDAQRDLAMSYIRQLDASHVFPAPIVTEVVPLAAFYPAEDYHQEYARRNPGQPYVARIALPKVEKLRAHYAQWLGHLEERR
ncbi:MAG TPA: peptide-methionine (S)-S-oxide reductase MsrA [Acidiferrobacteraceae bacterium]|nr:peptide-methionine (S)-S-oxide reductase MsrA [Acidiferrobacteraceae bacterium]